VLSQTMPNQIPVLPNRIFHGLKCIHLNNTEGKSHFPCSCQNYKRPCTGTPTKATSITLRNYDTTLCNVLRHLTSSLVVYRCSLGAFAELRKATISFIMFVCPSAWNNSAYCEWIFKQFHI
jgi:hypothetical protein